MKKFNIEKFHPCAEAALYYKTKKSFKAAWNECQRGDWMLWIAWHLKIDKKTFLKARLECAKTVEHLMKDARSLNALHAIQDYLDNKITADAAYAAYAAAAAAVRMVNRFKTANICRDILTTAVFKAIENESN